MEFSQEWDFPWWGLALGGRAASSPLPSPISPWKAGKAARLTLAPRSRDNPPPPLSRFGVGIGGRRGRQVTKGWRMSRPAAQLELLGPGGSRGLAEGGQP